MTGKLAIAIDGPAASGKSAVGSALAAQLRYRFVDTGAMYRALTWLVLQRAVEARDESAVVGLVDSARIEVREAAEGSPEATIVVSGRRGRDAAPPRAGGRSECVSCIARGGVRARLVQIQRELAEGGGIVMAGRDIGTVVLPHAELKVYLDASREVRAQRRAEQLRAAGVEPDIDELLADLERRDRIDSTRETSPLTAAAEAVIINTDNLSIEEVVRRIAALVPG